MNSVSSHICRSLQDIYQPQELKSLAMIVCRDILGMDMIDIYLGKDINLSESKQLELENIIFRLQKCEPIQYIRGTADFFGLEFGVAPGVLIPRTETEELVGLVVKENSEVSRILDIGTGSGCIAVSLAKTLPQSDVSAWDISDKALAIASKNAERLGVRVSFEKRDILSDLILGVGYYDVIVSNPPYVTEIEKLDMEPNVLDWEPELALFVPDHDPLLFYRRIATLGRELLNPEGKLYFEINQAYGVQTTALLERLHYNNIRIIKDFFGKDRIVTAEL